MRTVQRPIAVLGVAALLCCAALRAQPESAELHRRADLALESLLMKYWNGSYLQHSYPGPSGNTGYWTFAQGFDAVLDGVERTEGRRFSGWIETFYRAQERRGWSNDWFDDMNWMALALVRAHDLTGEQKYLDRSVELFEEIRGAWDETCCGDTPGGIWWNRAHSQKATASNAGPVIAAVRLYDRIGDESYLAFAQQVFDYWLDNMFSPAGQVIDHINPDGEKVPWKFTYNEGLMMGAAIELFRVTEDRQFRTAAVRFFSFMRQNETRVTAVGRVLDDGTNSSCGGDCHAFKGVAYRYLALVNEIYPNSQFQDLLDASAEAVWTLAQDDADVLFTVDWAGGRMTSFSEPQMVSAVIALNVHANASGPYPIDVPAGSVEAEEAILENLSLGNAHEGFTGFGYVADWNRDQQSVAVKVEVDSAQSRKLSLRYSAAEGEAVREILLNGETWIANAVFPETSSWGEYATVEWDVELPAGRHEIRILFDSGASSVNTLQLDRIDIAREGPVFVRGDANADSRHDLSDAVATLTYLFLDLRAEPDCLASADADDNGRVELTDAVFSLNYLFLNGRPPTAPYPTCDVDPTADDLSCAFFEPCS